MQKTGELTKYLLCIYIYKQKYMIQKRLLSHDPRLVNEFSKMTSIIEPLQICKVDSLFNKINSLG